MSESRALLRIACRVCKEMMNLQSYADHMKSKHPEEDPKNLRVLGQKSILEAMKRRKVEPTLQETVDENENVDEEAAEEMETDTAEVRNETEEIEIKLVNVKVERILHKVNVEVDVSDCNTEEDKLFKRLEAIEKRVEVKEDVKNLVSKLENLELIVNENKLEYKEVDAEAAIKTARSIEEVTEKVPVFVFVKEEEKVVCQVCNEGFKGGHVCPGFSGGGGHSSGDPRGPWGW
jgi:hypothetical protein